MRHLVVAAYGPFSTLPGTSPWAWHDLLGMMIWTAVAVYVAARRFRFEPRRS